jgi:hypothetical protein
MDEDEQERELLEGFRRLGPAARNTVKTAVSLAVTAEEAVRRELTGAGSSPAEAETGNELAAIATA